MTKSARTTVTPVDTGAFLLNPGMGLTLTAFPSNVDNTGVCGHSGDLISIICFRMPWSFLEPEEGRFNWSLIDTPAQRWIARGKRIAIRVTCSEAWLPYATPEWVKDAGAVGWNYRYGKGRHAKGHSWDPDPADPVFLQMLEAFLRSLALRYDGNPNVAYVEAGSLGLSGLCRSALSSRIPDKLFQKAGRAHIDLYANAFKATPLVIGNGEPGSVEHASVRGFRIRYDELAPEGNSAVDWRSALHLIGDPRDGMQSTKRQDEDLDAYLEGLQANHASYAPAPPPFAESCDSTSEIVSRIARAVGYRFELQMASWPSSVPIGDPFEVEMRWRNAGAAPCYRGGFVSLTLKSANGGIVAVLVDEEFDVKCLMPEAGRNDGADDPAQTEDDSTAKTQSEMRASVLRRVRLIVGENDPLTPSGHYDLYVSIGLRDGTPIFELPLPQGDGSRRYLLGKIRLQSPY